MKRLRLGAAHAAIRRLIADSVRRSPDLRWLNRLHCVLLVSAGRSCYEVAAWHGASARTIERWVHAYAAQGAEGLMDRKRAGGRRARIAGLNTADLARDLALSPSAFGYDASRWTGRLLARHLAERHEVVLGPRQCQRLMRATGRGPVKR